MMAEPIRTAEELLERAGAGNLEASGGLPAQYRNGSRRSGVGASSSSRVPLELLAAGSPSRGGLT